MTRKITAAYPGRCPACQSTITPGDLLTPDPELDDLHVHVECLSTRVDLKPRETCPRCFIEKATNGECGCES